MEEGTGGGGGGSAAKTDDRHTDTHTFFWRHNNNTHTLSSLRRAPPTSNLSLSLFLSLSRSLSVISLGDSRQYFLSTASSTNGVVLAVCASSGQSMHPLPLSTKGVVGEMVCPKTGARERRKCARAV